MVTQRTVFTIEADDFGWLEARRTLARLPDTRLVGSTACRSDELERATDVQPDVIVATWRCEERLIIPMLRQLRPILPRATFVILAHDYDPDELLSLDDVGIWRRSPQHLLRARWGEWVYGDAAIVVLEPDDQRDHTVLPVRKHGVLKLGQPS